MNNEKKANSKVVDTTQAAKKRGPRLAKLRHALNDEGITLTELGKRCNLTRNGVSLRFYNDDCKLSELEKMVEAIGYELNLVITPKKTVKD